MSEDRSPQNKGKPLRLVWESPEELPVTYANQLQITHAGGNEFHIYFGYVEPPLTYGLTTEEIDDLPDELPVKPLTKIIVTPAFMKVITEVFLENLERFEQKEE
jgi:hypothetical protein